MNRIPNAIAMMLATSVLGFGLKTAVAAEPPVAVSPGSLAGVVIGDPCPTFSWGAERGARSYELAVYSFKGQGDDAKPLFLFREIVVGSASSWTPSLERCLERGGQYGWSVRALGADAASDWSQPKLFRVAPAPNKAEFERALQLVRSYLAAQAEVEQAGSDADRVETEGPDVGLREQAKVPPLSNKGVALPTLFSVAGSAFMAGDLKIGGSLVSEGDICIGNCP